MAFAVAPREGRVSRNALCSLDCKGLKVAPREGRVSRNYNRLIQLLPVFRVAPREGRVSRNLKARFSRDFMSQSRPARGV